MLLTKFTTQKSIVLILILIGTLLFFGCQKNLSSDGGTAPEQAPDLTTKITTPLVSGFVTDENDIAVKSASVEVGGVVTTTDKYGYFEVRNASVVEKAAVVAVLKTGYFKAVKTFIGSAGKSAFFRIKLLPKKNAGSFSAASGGMVALSNGLKIELPANAVVNATTNVTYTGTVNVAAHIIMATDPDLNRIMPGDLRGLNTNNNLRILTTYGMAAVELTGAGGELLQVAPGKKATLTMPIHASLMASAPASIPLWYFDEAKGLWKEEGSATKTGSNYIGEVSHFSYWNCDVPANYVQFNCTVVNQSGQPLQNILVKVIVVSSGATGYGYTDSTGYTGGAVPNNSSLRLEIYSSNSCANSIYTQNFTTSNTNISLGTITVNTTSSQAIVTGTVTNCSNAPVANGYIILQSGTQNYRYPVIAGTFNFNAILCSAPVTVSIIAEDVTNLQQSVAAPYVLNTGSNTIGNIQACGVSTQQFINFTVNGTPHSFIPPADSLFQGGAGNTDIIVEGIGPGKNISLNFKGTGIGVNSSQQLNHLFTSYINDSTRILTPIFVTITEYGAVGQFIAGNFTGTFTGSSPANTPYATSLSFRVKRRN
jgi:hypothetical protein